MKREKGSILATDQSAIEARGITKIFQGAESKEAFKALDNVSVTIRENEFFTLLGPSGCGKTTLLRLIAGFDFPTEGEILLNGQDIAPLPPFKRPVNTVFQSYALFPHMTVAQNIGFGLEMLGKPKAEIDVRVSQMLALVRMEDMRHRKTSQISGGQQQRVALARALAPQPKVLLLDEPLSALDAKLRKEMQIELKRLQHETGITFIFVTHDQEEALTMSDRIATMHKGQILQVGTARDIYDRPANRFVADFIGETNFLDGTVISHKMDIANIRLGNGAMIAAGVPEGFLPSGQVTVAIRPEHTDITRDPTQTICMGTISNIVFFGTDTYYYIKLDGGSEFVSRRQNSWGGTPGFEMGERIGIEIEEGAARVLKD